MALSAKRVKFGMWNFEKVSEHINKWYFMAFTNYFMTLPLKGRLIVTHLLTAKYALDTSCYN